MEIYRKKRRGAPGPNKNEIRASRAEDENRKRASAGSLQDHFPQAQSLELVLRWEAVSGATLESARKTIRPEDSMMLNVLCSGGCSGGEFLLTEAVEEMLRANRESREGMAICQAGSYMDPSVVCGTKLYYQIKIQYKPA